jgi:membrane-bound serine protease (ClpP class)
LTAIRTSAHIDRVPTKGLRPSLLLLPLCLSLLGWLSGGSALAATAVHIHITGVINPVKVRYVQQGFDKARAERADLLIVSLDTPGGLVTSMEAIASEMTNQPIPVVGFVEPPTAQATSAGAFLLLATDVAAMAPGTRVGAAHPVADGKPLEGAMDAKATNSLVSLAKSLASRHHRSESFAEAIVRDSTSYTADEAKKLGAVELIVTDLPELLRALDGLPIDVPNKKLTLHTQGMAVVDLPMSAVSRLVDRLSDPTLASIFLTLGVLGILYELSSPGLGIAGIVGAICLVLALVALSTLPLHVGGLALLVIGFSAIAIEIKAQTHGALAVGGLVAILLGVLVLIDESGYFGGAQRASIRVFGPVAAAVTLTFVAFAAVAARAVRAPARSGPSALVGKQGDARSAFVPMDDEHRGMVFVDGTRWQAIANEAVAEGDAVVVEGVLAQPTRLRVRRVAKGGT